MLGVVDMVLTLQVLNELRDPVEHGLSWKFMDVVVDDLCNRFEVVELEHIVQRYKTMSVWCTITLEFVSYRQRCS